MTNNWHTATLIESYPVAEDIKGLKFRVENWEQHVPGQHYAIRLTSPEGYIAERDYSIANSPEEKGIVELGVELLENGEVSPFLHQMKNGEQIEMKGPLGGHFIWTREDNNPLFLICGGSGIVPLMCMLRTHVLHLSEENNRKVVLLGSFKTQKHILYNEELTQFKEKDNNLSLFLTLTRETPDGWSGYTRRVDNEMLSEVSKEIKDKSPLIYICGPTLFVEAVADSLVSMGFNAGSIKTERFG